MLPDLRWTCQLMYVPACKFVRWIGRSLWKITWRWDPWFLRWYGTQGVAWYSWSIFKSLVAVCGEMPHLFLKKPISTKIEGCDDVRTAEATWDLYGWAKSSGGRGQVRLDWSWHSYLQPFGSRIAMERSITRTPGSFCQHSLITSYIIL